VSWDYIDEKGESVITKKGELPYYRDPGPAVTDAGLTDEIAEAIVCLSGDRSDPDVETLLLAEPCVTMISSIVWNGLPTAMACRHHRKPH